ncbi:MAG: hypothetical protein HKP61_12650 [Dactylosporangium sp.]|nr:hypothetical protein [Dactylosporangium sp.]NNJ61768.1 hypothetical protein [Dactylosporangium sp.]
MKAHPTDLLPDGLGGLAADRWGEGREDRGLSLLRLAEASQVKRLTESIAADRMRILPVLAAALKQ